MSFWVVFGITMLVVVIFGSAWLFLYCMMEVAAAENEDDLPE